jgi:hypothetical protein
MLSVTAEVVNFELLKDVFCLLPTVEFSLEALLLASPIVAC